MNRLRTDLEPQTIGGMIHDHNQQIMPTLDSHFPPKRNFRTSKQGLPLDRLPIRALSGGLVNSTCKPWQVDNVFSFHLHAARKLGGGVHYRRIGDMLPPFAPLACEMF